MSHFIVTPYIKEDNKYALFSVNSSFGIEEEKQFRSVEEAKDFPLVPDVLFTLCTIGTPSRQCPRN